MEIITSDSETLLAESLPLVEKEADAWLCIHINLVPLHEQLLHQDGLSKQSLDKVLQVSLQMADYMMEWGLKECEGKLFVFKDSDLLCLMRKNPALTDQVVARLQQEFTQSNLLHLLHFHDMRDRLASIMTLSAEKYETADAYRLKQCAILQVDKLMERGEPDSETTRLIQKKRRCRGNSCVLIIEDDVLTRGMLATLLRDHHQVVQAKDAREGIMHYIDHAPDIVFLDIHLPGMNGNEVLKRIKMLDSQAYVVMLSGDSVPDNITLAKKYGAVGFIRKPFSKEKVLEYVSQCPSIVGDSSLRALGCRNTNS